MSDIIHIERLSKHFGSVVGVDDISLSVKTGEFVTLLGPSGCGKSTLLRMIGGFEEPDAGRIWLDGQDVTDTPPHRRAVNMVFQDYALFPHMTVGKNVGYGLRVSRMPAHEMSRRTEAALDLVGLTDKIAAMPHHLSGGQRQRVALARALVREPKVLLLDEPLSALDANLREAMQVELRHLHNQVGLTFIMVTHDQDEALAMSDRVVVMREGRIVQDGAPDHLYEQPNSAYVAGFVGTTNLFRSQIGDNGRVSFHGQSLALPEAFRTGGHRLFGFRPERIRLLSPDAVARVGPDSSILTGTVNDVLYHGSLARIVVAIAETTILVDVQVSDTGGRSSLPQPGETVALDVPPEAIMVFTDEAAA